MFHLLFFPLLTYLYSLSEVLYKQTSIHVPYTFHIITWLPVKMEIVAPLCFFIHFLAFMRWTYSFSFPKHVYIYVCLFKIFTMPMFLLITFLEFLLYYWCFKKLDFGFVDHLIVSLLVFIAFFTLMVAIRIFFFVFYLL